MGRWWKKMIEFYTWRLTMHSLVTVLLILCVLAQALATILSHYRRLQNASADSSLRPLSIQARWDAWRSPTLSFFENLLELSILLNIIVLSMLQGQAINAHSTSILYPAGYGDLRYMAFSVIIFIVLFACIVLVHTKKARLLLVIAFAFLTFPAVEAAAGGVFAWLYIAALLFWLLRGIRVCILRYREIETGISSLSIKNTIDSMHTGVVFSALDGHILLSNARMSGLMTILTGKIHRNANQFYEALVSGELRGGCNTAEYDEQIVCRLPDQTAWIFAKTKLQIRNKTYIQLTADDITERWALTEQLRQQETELKLRGDELKDTIANLHILSREKELQNTKLRTHDILGGWLTMLLHAIRNEQVLDLDMLRIQSRSLPRNLTVGQGVASARDKFDSVRRSFETIGVEIHLDGDLPGDEVKGHLLIDVIGEGVVNAVRHGFATKVSVQIERTEVDWHLEITDNGRPPIQPIIEGGGIGGVRKKLEPHGGTLKVTADPRFVLTVDLP